MTLKNDSITIRNATVDDANLLTSWWNDGSVMAHAGFPNGLGITVEQVKAQIEAESDHTMRRHIILFEDIPIGEMNYHNLGGCVCEIGIKICEVTMQNRGVGKQILRLFIDGLFSELGYKKIVLDTNLNNHRAQHVYEQLGFQKVRINYHSWKDQLGNLQSSVDYELVKEQLK